MAYIRSKRISGHTYYYLVEGIRDGEKVRQKHIRYIGKYRAAYRANPRFFHTHRRSDHLRLLPPIIELFPPTPTGPLHSASSNELGFSIDDAKRRSWRTRDAEEAQVLLLGRELGHRIYAAYPEVQAIASSLFADSEKSPEIERIAAEIAALEQRPLAQPRSLSPEDRLANFLGLCVVRPGMVYSTARHASTWLLEHLHELDTVRKAFRDARLWQPNRLRVDDRTGTYVMQRPPEFLPGGESPAPSVERDKPPSAPEPVTGPEAREAETYLRAKRISGTDYWYYIEKNAKGDSTETYVGKNPWMRLRPSRFAWSTDSRKHGRALRRLRNASIDHESAPAAPSDPVDLALDVGRLWYRQVPELGPQFTASSPELDRERRELRTAVGLLDQASDEDVFAHAVAVSLTDPSAADRHPHLTAWLLQQLYQQPRIRESLIRARLWELEENADGVPFDTTSTTVWGHTIVEASAEGYVLRGTRGAEFVLTRKQNDPTNLVVRSKRTNQLCHLNGIRRFTDAGGTLRPVTT